MIADAQNGAMGAELASTLKMQDITSVMCVPMMSTSEIVGVIYVDSMEKPYPFALEDILFLRTLLSELQLLYCLKTLRQDDTESGTEGNQRIGG
jgi:hypothetical protein